MATNTHLKLDASGVAESISGNLGRDFRTVATDGFVLVGHPRFGLAVVIAGDDEETARSAAAEVELTASSLGIQLRCRHFGVIEGQSEAPWILPLPEASKALADQMSRTEGDPSIPQGHLDEIMNAVIMISSASTKDELPPSVVRMTEACIDRALDGSYAWVAGIEIAAADVAGPRFLLPAILVAAAERWALPVAASGGKGGFEIGLVQDDGAVLGYRVTNIRASAPLLLFLPIVSLVKGSFRKGECHLDDVVRSFARFLRRNGLNSSAIEDVDVRIVASA